MDNQTFTALRDAIRKFVAKRLIPAEDIVEETNEVPADIIQEMRELGLFGLTVPESYGGIGLTMAEEAQVIYELGHTAFAFRSVIGTTIGIGSQGIVMDGTDEQKAEWLPRLASGEIVASFALTEPEAGSDAASIKTTAHRDGTEYVLNGTKRFITNAPRAGAFTVMARTDTTKPGADGISAFIVPADLPGITLGRIDKKMGQRGTQTCDVIFDGCRVPAANIIGAIPGRGFKTAMKVLDRGRIHLSALACGMCERLIAESLAYATQRKQFGSPISNFQLLQAMLADSRVDASVAWALTQQTAAAFDCGENVSMEAACSKYFSSEAVGRVADRAVQIHGGAGYMAESKVERFYRDVRLLRIYEGTSQIQQLLIARKMLQRFSETH